MRKCYERFYDAFNGKVFRYNKSKEFNDLAYFVPMEGSKYCNCKDYQGTGLRLMLVGRAVNGWNKMNAQNKIDFITEINNQFNNNILDKAITLNAKGRLCFNPKSRYTLTRSPFWRTAKKIWEGLVRGANPAEPKWIENIVWSNLYKVSPYKTDNTSKTANPTKMMCDLQQLICRNLLKEEIEFYKPTHILLVTDWNWIADYKENSFLSVFLTHEKTEDRYVVGTAWYECCNGVKIPVVITCRPEGNNETAFVNDVLEYFRKLKE